MLRTLARLSPVDDGKQERSSRKTHIGVIVSCCPLLLIIECMNGLLLLLLLFEQALLCGLWQQGEGGLQL